MKGVSLETDGGHLRVGDGYAIDIAPAIELRSDAEARSTVGRGNQADNGGETDERCTAPDHCYVREEPMFDLVPLARPRWEVTHRNGEAGPIRELLQFPVVCENSADRLRGLAVIELEHAAEPLIAPD